MRTWILTHKPDHRDQPTRTEQVIADNLSADHNLLVFTRGEVVVLVIPFGTFVRVDLKP